MKLGHYVLFTGCLLGVSIFSCGQKKDKTEERTTPGNGDNSDEQNALRPVAIADESQRPECGGSTRGMLIYVRSIDQFQVCLDDVWEKVERDGKDGSDGSTGATGSKGDKGEKGETGAGGGAFNFNVKDANGVIIGATDFHEYANFLYNSEVFFRLSDGVVMDLNVLTGRNNGEFCYFASNNCTGGCLFPNKTGEKNKVVEGLSGLFLITGTEVATNQTYQSYAIADNPTPSCTVLGAPVSAQLISVSATYTPPTGTVYPFPAPVVVLPQ